MRGGHAILVRLSTATIKVKPTRRVAVELAVRSAVSARTPLIARRPDRPNLSRAKENPRKRISEALERSGTCAAALSSHDAPDGLPSGQLSVRPASSLSPRLVCRPSWFQLWPHAATSLSDWRRPSGASSLSRKVQCRVRQRCYVSAHP